MSMPQLRSQPSLSTSDYSPETTDNMAEILAGRFLTYFAFCIIIALITFIAIIFGGRRIPMWPP